MKNDQEDGQGARVLVINPGSTSTKVGVFEASLKNWEQTLEHRQEELDRFDRIVDQLPWREGEAARALDTLELDTGRIAGVSARAGLLRPVPGGTYAVTDKMCVDLEEAKYGEHSSNLGPLLARRFSARFGVPSFVVDPVTTDEFEPASRLSGVPGVERKCRNHTLNIKAVARRASQRLGKDLADTRFVVAHMGGGVSVCALRHGRIVDSTDALLGEGPFSGERAGTLPLAGTVALCFDGGPKREDITRLLSRGGGLKGYLGTARLPEVYDRIGAGDADARLVLDAMVLQIVKWIGAMTAVLQGNPDGILLTGGMALADRFVAEISSFISALAPIQVFPGSLEMEALAEGAFRVLSGLEEALTY